MIINEFEAGIWLRFLFRELGSSFDPDPKHDKDKEAFLYFIEKALIAYERYLDKKTHREHSLDRFFEESDGRFIRLFERQDQLYDCLLMEYIAETDEQKQKSHSETKKLLEYLDRCHYD